MPVNESRLLDYLAKNYASSISKRALWSWCGGAEAEIDYDLPPLEGWGRMWSKAGENSVPTRIGLVREMLFDSPGQATLLNYLEALAAERFESERKVVAVFLFLLAGTKGPESRLAALLYLLQDLPPDCILAAAAPAIQANRGDKCYADLEKALLQFNEKPMILTPGILVAWIEFYLACLADDESLAPAPLAKVVQAKESLAVLKAHIDDAARPEDLAEHEEKLTADMAAGPDAADRDMDKPAERKAALEETTRRLETDIEELIALSPESGIGAFEPVVRVVAALLELVQSGGLAEEGVALQLSAAQPVRAALWATRARQRDD